MDFEHNISILGSTGSIGTQALQVVDDLKGIKDITVKAITGNANTKLLEEQAEDMVVDNIFAHGRKTTHKVLLRFLHKDGFVIVLGTLRFQHQHTDRFLRFRNNFYNILLLQS